MLPSSNYVFGTNERDQDGSRPGKCVIRITEDPLNLTDTCVKQRYRDSVPSFQLFFSFLSFSIVNSMSLPSSSKTGQTFYSFESFLISILSFRIPISLSTTIHHLWTSILLYRLPIRVNPFLSPFQTLIIPILGIPVGLSTSIFLYRPPNQVNPFQSLLQTLIIPILFKNPVSLFVFIHDLLTSILFNPPPIHVNTFLSFLQTLIIPILLSQFVYISLSTIIYIYHFQFFSYPIESLSISSNFYHTLVFSILHLSRIILLYLFLKIPICLSISIHQLSTFILFNPEA